MHTESAPVQQPPRVRRYILRGRIYGLGRLYVTTGGDAGLAALVAIHDPFQRGGL